MYKCDGCGAEFEKPEQMKIGIAETEILIVCPRCGDDRISYLWDEPKKNKERRNNE